MPPHTHPSLNCTRAFLLLCALACSLCAQSHAARCLDGWCRSRDLDAAMQAWQDMQALGIKPDLILYSALIDTCAKVRAITLHDMT